MNGRITIDSDLLRAHAARVDQVAADARVALQAAGETMLSAGAFGLMCGWMIPPFLATAGAASATIASTASALDRSAREVRALATDFDDFEQGVSSTLRDLHSGLGVG